MEATKKRMSRRIAQSDVLTEQETLRNDSDEDFEEVPFETQPPIKTQKNSVKKEIPPKPKRMKAALNDADFTPSAVESSPLMCTIEQDAKHEEKTKTNIEEVYQQQFEQKQVKQRDEISNNLIASKLFWLSKNTQSEAFRIVFKDLLPFLQIGSFEYDRITTTFRPCRSTPWGSANTQFKSVAEIPLGDSHLFDLFKGKFQDQFAEALVEAEQKKKEYEDKLIAQQQRYQQSRYGYKSNSYM